MITVTSGLEERGWIVEEVNREELVKVDPDGLGPCVDGREPSDSELNMRGAKVQGGVFGVAALGVGGGDGEVIWEAVQRYLDAGYVPAVHGDEGHGEEGCGFGKLWKEGAFGGDLPELEVSLAEARKIVEQMGGEYVELQGDHREKSVIANFVKGKTVEPDGSAFVLDVWVAEELGIDPNELVQNAVRTVELLDGPRKLEIIK